MFDDLFKNSLESLNSLIKENRFKESLQLVDDLLQRSPGSVSLLIKKAMLIQLQDDNDQIPSLEDARLILKKALEIEPKSVEAYIELGNFEYAVNDTPSAALMLFEQATIYAKSNFKDALIGLIKSQIELGYFQKAQKKLEEALIIFPDDSEFLELEDELSITKLEDNTLQLETDQINH